MEFMLNGPRLQASLFDGSPNWGSFGEGYASAYQFPTWARQNGAALTGVENSPVDNSLRIRDLADGRQVVAPSYFSVGSGISYIALCKYALKTNTPDTYLILTAYRWDDTSYISFERTKLGRGPFTELATQQTLTVTLSTAEWGHPRTAFTAFASTNANTWCRTLTGTTTINDTVTSDVNWKTDSAVRVGSTIDGTTATLSITFPATYRTVLHKAGGTGVLIFPRNLNGRKYATMDESITSLSSNSASPYDLVSKVYSPYKNCLCLKSYLNGEIPIFNE